MPKKAVVFLAALAALGAGWLGARILLDPYEASSGAPMGRFEAVDRRLAEAGLRKEEPYPDPVDPSVRVVVYDAGEEEHGERDVVTLWTDGEGRVVRVEASFLMRPEEGHQAMGPRLRAASFIAGYWDAVCGAPDFEHFETGGGAPLWGPFDQAVFASAAVDAEWTRNPMGGGDPSQVWSLNEVRLTGKGFTE